MSNKNLFDVSDVPIVAGTGLVALDVVINHATGAPQKVFTGGTCGNVLTILSYLGWLAYPIARMDRDAASKKALADFKKWGVQTDLTQCVPTGNTPVVIHNIRRAQDGHNYHRFTFTCPSCGAWLPGFKAVTASEVEGILAKLPHPKVFFFDRLSRAATNLAKAYAERGALVVFEPSGLGDPKLFREVLPHVHVLKYSNERLNEMSGLHFAHTPLLTIETLGSEGLRYRSKISSCKTDGWQSLDAFSLMTVTDTAGAGDWCTAGIIHLIGAGGAAGFSQTSQGALRHALMFGQALAAWNCQFESARGGMYVTDKRTFHRQINKILLGEAHKLVSSTTKSPPKAAFFRCSAPGCPTQRQISKGKKQVVSIPERTRVRIRAGLAKKAAVIP
jgi:sugar/nucleoside kinase (ribokinase family)